MTEKKAKTRKADFHDSFPNIAIRELFKTSEAKKGFAKQMGITVEAIRQWTGGYARPDAENLIGVADYFGVSFDYLFGRTPFRNESIEKQKIYELTGLSEEAINNLEIFKDAEDVTDFINFLLGGDFFLDLCLNVKKYEIELIASVIGSDYEAHSDIKYLKKLKSHSKGLQIINARFSNCSENKKALNPESLEQVKLLFEKTKNLIASYNEADSINSSIEIPPNKSIVDVDEAKQIALWRIGRLSEKIAEDYIKSKTQTSQKP